MECLALILWRGLLLVIMTRSTLGYEMSGCNRVEDKIIEGKNSQGVRGQGLGKIIHIEVETVKELNSV